MPEISKAMRALLCGAFCFIVLAGMLVGHAWPLLTGETIYLEVIARDPRDLFRGDYVVLTYPIEQLVVATGSVPPSDVPEGAPRIVVEPQGDWWDAIVKELVTEDYSMRQTWRDRVVYVQLEAVPSQTAGVPQVHRAMSVSDVPIPGSVNLKGRIWNLARMQYDDSNSPIEMSLRYGIDALYVQEGTGLQIEAAIRKGNVHAIVAVTASGSARLSDLVIEGRPWSSIRAGN
jgi:uncharacterized membrane-anchored protein